MINKIIRNFIAKQMAGRSDDGIMITLKDPQRVTLGENIMADLLIRNGIDPRAITSEAQLKTILNQIEAVSKQTTRTDRDWETQITLWVVKRCHHQEAEAVLMISRRQYNLQKRL